MKFTIFFKSYFLTIISILILFSSCKTRSHELALIKNGKTNSVIVVPKEISELQQMAVDNFVETIIKSSGAEIPVVSEQDVLSIPESTVKIVVGPSILSDSILGDTITLKPEEFKIISKENYLVLLAKDLKTDNVKKESRVTMWAFDYILDNYLNVRWLWPGDLGTVIPKMKNIKIPKTNVALQQPLVKRDFRTSSSHPELLQWKTHHQVMGQRESINISHAFVTNSKMGNWWTKFSKTHPEYLAMNPEGKVALRDPSHLDRYKLNVSNLDVVNEIVKMWEEAGKPDFWNVAPNDSRGYCTCDNCLELDRKYGYENSKNETYTGEAVLTGRYVWFWNQIITKMRKINPKVQIGTYFYSNYREPPKNLKLEKGIVGGLVPDFDFSDWEGWTNAGASGIGLRPNWWHSGGNGPYLFLRQAGNYIAKGRENKMNYIDMDSLMEFWATQGSNYYLAARLIARPDLSVEEIITEYCDVFGEASEEIRNYLSYWEDYHKKVAYNIPTGGWVSQDSTGIYETVSREHLGRVYSPLNGHWKTLPYIYTEDILSGGYQILDNATAKAKDEEVIKRIDFLRDGLNQLVKTSKIISYDNLKDDSGRIESLKDLKSFSNKMEEKYGYWGSNGISVMKHRVFPKDLDLEGL